jgi:hypothetical protein
MASFIAPAQIYKPGCTLRNVLFCPALLKIKMFCGFLTRRYAKSSHGYTSALQNKLRPLNAQTVQVKFNIYLSKRSRLRKHIKYFHCATASWSLSLHIIITESPHHYHRASTSLLLCHHAFITEPPHHYHWATTSCITKPEHIYHWATNLHSSHFLCNVLLKIKMKLLKFIKTSYLSGFQRSWSFRRWF